MASLLTEYTLLKHTKAALRAHNQHIGGSEIASSLPSTEIDSIEYVGLNSEERRNLEARYFPADIPDNLKLQQQNFVDPINGRSIYPQPHFTPPPPPTIDLAAMAGSPLQLIDSDHNSAQLIETTSNQEDQLQDILPSHFPRFQHIRNWAELGFYIDQSQYALRVGSGPLDDLKYGIIIVPVGEEHMLFRSEHEHEVPSEEERMLFRREHEPKGPLLAVQHESTSRSIDNVQPGIVQPGIVNSVRKSSLGALPRLFARGSWTAQVNLDNSSRITKTIKTHRPQTNAPLRRRKRLKAGRRAT